MGIIGSRQKMSPALRSEPGETGWTQGNQSPRGQESRQVTGMLRAVRWQRSARLGNMMDRQAEGQLGAMSQGIPEDRLEDLGTWGPSDLDPHHISLLIAL